MSQYIGVKALDIAHQVYRETSCHWFLHKSARAGFNLHAVDDIPSIFLGGVMLRSNVLYDSFLPVFSGLNSPEKYRLKYATDVSSNIFKAMVHCQSAIDEFFIKKLEAQSKKRIKLMKILMKCNLNVEETAKR